MSGDFENWDQTPPEGRSAARLPPELDRRLTAESQRRYRRRARLRRLAWWLIVGASLGFAVWLVLEGKL
jgi:ferric-dicitrate binding protein FerR (iron transport regulator)